MTTNSTVVYTDGTVATMLPAGAPHGLTGYRGGHLDPCQLTGILADLAAVDPPDGRFGNSDVSDAEMLVVTTHTGGSFPDADFVLPLDDLPGMGPNQLTGDQKAARQQRLRDLLHRICYRTILTDSLPARLKVVSRMEIPPVGISPANAEKVQPWPLGGPVPAGLAKGGPGCLELAGVDASKLVGAINRKSPAASTFDGKFNFTSGTVELGLAVLPPGESACDR